MSLYQVLTNIRLGRRKVKRRELVAIDLSPQRVNDSAEVNDGTNGRVGPGERGAVEP